MRSTLPARIYLDSTRGVRGSYATNQCGTQVRAPCAGTVTSLAALTGAQVNDGHILAVVVPPTADKVAAAA